MCIRSKRRKPDRWPGFLVVLAGSWEGERPAPNQKLSDLLLVQDLPADPGEPDRGMGVAVLGFVVLGKPGFATWLGAHAIL